MFLITVEENNKEIVLSWDRVAGATTYRIYRSDAVNVLFRLIATVSSSSYIDNITVINSTPYVYYVEAYSASLVLLETSEQVITVANSLYKWLLPLHIGTFFYGDDNNLNREFYVYSNPSSELMPSGVFSYTLNNYPLQNAPIAVYLEESDIPLVSTALSVANVNASGSIPQIPEDRTVPMPSGEVEERNYYLMSHNDFVVYPSGVLKFTNPLDSNYYVMYEKEEDIFNNNKTIDINPLTGNVHTGFLYIDEIGDGYEISLKQSNYLIPADGKSTIKYIATLRDSKGNRVYVNNTTKEVERLRFKLMITVIRIIDVGVSTATFFNPIEGNVFTDHPSITNISVLNQYEVSFSNTATTTQLVKFYFGTTDNIGTLEPSSIGTSENSKTIVERLDRYGQAVAVYRSSETNYGSVGVLVSLVSNPNVKTLSDGDATLGGRSIYEGPFQLDQESLDGPSWLISQDMYDNFYSGKYDPSLQGIFDAFDTFYYDEFGNFIY